MQTGCEQKPVTKFLSCGCLLSVIAFLAFPQPVTVAGLHLLPWTRWQDPTNMFYQCLILQGTYLHLFSDHLVISTGSQERK